MGGGRETQQVNLSHSLKRITNTDFKLMSWILYITAHQNKMYNVGYKVLPHILSFREISCSNIVGDFILVHPGSQNAVITTGK